MGANDAQDETRPRHARRRHSRRPGTTRRGRTSRDRDSIVARGRRRPPRHRPKDGNYLRLAARGYARVKIMNPPIPRSPRLASIDAYRGFVMFLMMAEVLHLRNVAKAVPESQVWEFLAHHQSHVEWAGWSLHDLIQPSFPFLGGVALPASHARRQG